MEPKFEKSMNWKWLLVVLVLATIVACVVEVPFEEIIVPIEVTEPPTSVMGDSTGGWYEVYFTSPAIPFDDVYTGGIENHLIEKIDSAQTSIDVAVFEFDIESVAEALIRALNRGVNVRVVYDNEHTESDPQLDELINAGIPAVPDNRSAFMHNKFFVFDDYCVWTGSFNISMNAAYRNNENALYFCSSEAADNYSTEFNEMFAGQFGASSPSDTPYPVFYIDSIKIENYFAAEDGVMDKIITAINEAHSSIHFMAYSFTDDNLGQSMIDKAREGIIVKGVFETVGANTEYSECKWLLLQGIDVRLDGNLRTFHHKVIIIDGSIVILGSFNFSANADIQNDENLLIIHDPMLASAYEEEFQRMLLKAVIPSDNTCTK